MIAFPKKTWKELDNQIIGVFDGETNGFLKVVTKLHCIVSIDPRSRTVRSFTPRTIQVALDYLHTLDVLVGHNIIGFDLPVMKKLFNWVPLPHQIILDTLWMSRLYNPDVEGGHSINAWGSRLHNQKIEYYPVHDPLQPHYDPDEEDLKNNPGWDESIYTENMGDYCTQDVEVNVDLFNKLLELLINFSWRSIICEMECAVIIQRQMEHGFAFDYRAADMLHAKLMERKHELEDIVHTTFLPLPKLIREVQPKVKQDGKVSSVGLKKLGDSWEKLIVPPEYIEHRSTRETIVAKKKGQGLPADLWNDDWAIGRILREEQTEYKGVALEVVDKVEIRKEYTSGSFSLIEFPEFSLGSRQQIAERLVRGGYKLTKFTEKGNAIIDDSTLEDAVKKGIKEAKPLAEYFMITKREGMVRDWLKRAEYHEDEGIWRIHGFVNSMGAATNRMTHNSPNVAQVPASGTPYGSECRALFTVAPGNTLVGCDASGLELRCLSHYMLDEDYMNAVVSGDVHWINTLALGLIAAGTVRDKSNEFHEEMRDLEKVFVYSWLYGAGIKRVAETLKVTMKVAKQKMESFLNKTPALKKLREKIKALVEKRSWLKGVDGRILRVRMPHAALNTLLQGMGAIVMKYWLIEVTKNADAEGLSWNPVANIHDEGQFEVLNKDVKRFKEICEAAFPKVSDDLNLFCPMAGTAMEGINWSKTH